MADKKIFPGLTEQDVRQKDEEQKKLEQEEAKRKAAAAKKAEEEQAKQEAIDFENSAKSLLNKFGKNKQQIKDKVKAYKSGAVRFLKTQAIPLGVFYVLWFLGLVTGGEYVVEGGRNEGFNLFAAAISKTDWEWKIEKGIKAKYFNPLNPLLETYNIPNIANKDTYKNLKDWDLRVIRAYVGLILVILGAVLAFGATKSALDKINAKIDEENDEKLQDIKRLLKSWKNKDINNMKLEDFRYIDMIKTIISHMSSQDATLFRQMLAGETYVSTEIASSIIVGHLKSHPEDAQLILDTFEEKYMPSNLVTQCKQLIDQKQYC